LNLNTLKQSLSSLSLIFNKFIVAHTSYLKYYKKFSGVINVYKNIISCDTVPQSAKARARAASNIVAKRGNQFKSE